MVFFFSFLTNRIHHFSINNPLSEPGSVSTGAPQGFTSFLVLHFRISLTALPSSGHHERPIDYFTEIESFVYLSDASRLIANARKPEETVARPRSVGDHCPVVIRDETIIQVRSYVGFSWKAHVEGLCPCLQQQLFFLPRLRVYWVDRMIIFSSCQASLESIVGYGMSARYGSLTYS